MKENKKAEPKKRGRPPIKCPSCDGTWLDFGRGKNAGKYFCNMCYITFDKMGILSWL